MIMFPLFPPLQESATTPRLWRRRRGGDVSSHLCCKSNLKDNFSSNQQCDNCFPVCDTLWSRQKTLLANITSSSRWYKHWPGALNASVSVHKNVSNFRLICFLFVFIPLTHLAHLVSVGIDPLTPRPCSSCHTVQQWGFSNTLVHRFWTFSWDFFDKKKKM